WARGRGCGRRRSGGASVVAAARAWHWLYGALHAGSFPRARGCLGSSAGPAAHGAARLRVLGGTPPASLSAAAGTAGRCLLTVMWRTSMTGRRGPELPCHSSPLRLLRPPRPSGHGRGGRRPGDRACRLHLALERGHQLALMVTSYLNHQAGVRSVFTKMMLQR
uniref:Uncharacterized protein n=1 Tax=Aegilops tauschii subsp. strangulata TaxID=200361 RepID=A0A453B1B2_AEGTS